MRSLLILFLIHGFAANATNYYISNISGNDGNSGTSVATAWKTLKKVNSFSGFVPGDAVLFKRGEIFYGSIMVKQSGNQGNPITFGAYGLGPNPVITGLTPVNEWVNLGNKIWESSNAVSALPTCNLVVVNGVNTGMGRYPNTGYLAFQSHNGNNSITSSSLNSSVINWTGAEIVLRPTRWMLQRNLITQQNGGTLVYSESSETPTNGYGFFIQNDSRTLDTANEWYFNPSTKKIRMFSVGTPANVQVSTIDQLVVISGSSYLTFDHIDFKGANSYLFENRKSRYIIVHNCSFSFAGKTAMYINNAVSANEIMTIDSNLFNNNNENAINFLTYTSKAWIKNNTINNTGIIPGSGTNSQNSCDAIVVQGAGNIIEYNTINHTGHSAIDMRHSDGMIVRYNYITYFGMTKYDAGGIYSWNFDSTTVKSRIIDHNIILFSNQTSEGIGEDSPSLFGIYLDGDSKNSFITHNTVAHCKSEGIHILNTGSTTITDNVCYDNGIQIGLWHAFGGGMAITGMVVKHNTFFSKANTQLAFYFRDDDNLHFSTFGTADSNYYASANDNNLSIKTAILFKATNRTLTQWKNYSGSDAHSLPSPKTIKNINDSRFEYNATSSPKTIALNANYIDVRGNVYNKSITLAPYTSVVLIKKD